MSSEVFARNVSDIRDQSRLYLFGGELQLRERRQTFERINELAMRNQLIPEKIPLEPPYFDELVEIVNRIISQSRHAWRILQVLDAVVLEGVLKGDYSFEAKLNDAFSVEALVLLKRITMLFQKHSNLEKEMFQELLAI
jgi:hypothetical protein